MLVDMQAVILSILYIWVFGSLVFGFDFSLLKCLCGVLHVGSGVGKSFFFFLLFIDDLVR